MSNISFKTFSTYLCFRKSVVGTPAYLAPEVLRNKGYNRSISPKVRISIFKYSEGYNRSISPKVRISIFKYSEGYSRTIFPKVRTSIV